MVRPGMTARPARGSVTVGSGGPPWRRGHLLLAARALRGCGLRTSLQMDECQQFSRTLRSENARLKDQLLVCRPRTATMPNARSTIHAGWPLQDEAIERLETQRSSLPGRARSPGSGLPPARIEPGRASPDGRAVEPGRPAPRPGAARAVRPQAHGRGDGDREGPRVTLPRIVDSGP